MSRQQQYVLMGRYNRDMNQRLFAAASKLDDDQLRSNMGAFFQSILGKPSLCGRCNVAEALCYAAI